MVNVEKKVSNSDGINAKELILKFQEWKKYLRFKWRTILIAIFIGIPIGLFYSIVVHAVYKTELTFALEDDNSSSGGGLGAAAGLASQFGIDIGGGNASGAFAGDNIMELLKSRRIVENSLLTTVNLNGKDQTLADLYISFNNLRDKWSDSPLLKNIEFQPNRDRSGFTLEQDSVLGSFYRAIIKKNLTIEKIDKKLDIVKIEFESKNELFSKYFTEALAKTVSHFYIETKTKKSVQNVNILQHQTDSVRRELNEAITGVAKSSDVNPNSNPTLQILRVQSQYRQIDVEANTAILTELVKNLELSKVTLRKETPLIQIIDSPILPLEKHKIGKILGMVLGGILGGFLAVLGLLTGRIFKDVME